MGRTTADIMAALPKGRRDRINARVAEEAAVIESLQALRKLAGKTQEQVAASLGVKQPSIQKMEKQTDFYVSTLRRFVEAAGGEVDIVVRLPGHKPVKLREFADLHPGGTRQAR